MKRFLLVLVLFNSAVMAMDRHYAHEYVMWKAQQQPPEPTTITTRQRTRTFAPGSEVRIDRDPQGGQRIYVWDSWWRKALDKPKVIHD